MWDDKFSAAVIWGGYLIVKSFYTSIYRAFKRSCLILSAPFVALFFLLERSDCDDGQ